MDTTQDKIDSLIAALVDGMTKGKHRWREGERIGEYRLAIPDVGIITLRRRDVLEIKDRLGRVIEEAHPAGVNQANIDLLKRLIRNDLEKRKSEMDTILEQMIAELTKESDHGGQTSAGQAS